MKNRWSGMFAAGLALAVTLAFPVVASDRTAKSRYVPPDGFAGRTWGELRTSFNDLPQQPMGVAAAWILAKEKSASFTCVISVDGCDFQATLLRIQREYEGGGFYVLSEYAVPDQGFRIGDGKADVLMHPVVYQFCANWHSSVKKKTVPPNFDSLNQFCGMRLHFKSETREELARLPGDYVSTYDRMLELMISKFGKPVNHVRHGRVIVETEEGKSLDIQERKFNIYRWCPADGDGFHTRCKASVTLSVNPTTGVGTVLYSTPLLWEYAYARDLNRNGDKLYQLLQAKR